MASDCDAEKDENLLSEESVEKAEETINDFTNLNKSEKQKRITPRTEESEN